MMLRLSKTLQKNTLRGALNNGANWSHKTFKLQSDISHQRAVFHSGKVLYSSSSAPQVSMQQLSESFLNGSSSLYAEKMYYAWKKDPSSVHASWRSYFENVDVGLPPGQAFQLPTEGVPLKVGTQSGSTFQAPVGQTVTESMRLLLLIRAYQVRGHLLANLVNNIDIFF
jgi:hypothetical protein